jgi:hypothetical protein
VTAYELATLLRARRVGRDKWMACCPAHGDKHASLSITAGRKQPVLLKCMSQGCTTKEILAALGLKWRDICGERLDPSAVRKLEQEREQRELAKRAMRNLVHTALEKARYWYRRADKLAAYMATNEKMPAMPFHEALRKARYFENLADWMDDSPGRGNGVPRLTRPEIFR